ncbi:MAG: peptidoglycan recognition protein family protein [Chloroflexaceae bacterium]|jgi:hypothetical protein|nr:peptidoglycan recognition protein family protein [Chloroflexaceae bacterium]
MTDFPATGMPPMIGKMLTTNEWLDYVRSYQWGPVRPTKVVLHHTYIPNEQQWRGASSMRGMQAYYAGLGWWSAPHVYTAPDGIWLFTPLRNIGIHAGTGNGSLEEGWYSIGLEMVGFFDHQRPQGKVWEHALAVMGSISLALDIPPRQLITFHRDYTGTKSCPGWAVTKPWVWGEVERWIAAHTGAAAPAPAAPAAPTPPPPIDPEREPLIAALLNESYRKRSPGYNEGWAFHQVAVEQELGAPLGASTRLDVAGKAINYQIFARDMLYCEVPNWGDVRRLSQLLAEAGESDALAQGLLATMYRDAGVELQPESPLYQAARMLAFGPPLANPGSFSIRERSYQYQIFAADTLLLPPDSTSVQSLALLDSQLQDPDLTELRAMLVDVTYAATGTPNAPGSAFHTAALQAKLGTPLGDIGSLELNGRTLAVQVFALDTLYAEEGASVVQRLGDLLRGVEPPKASAKGYAVISESDGPRWYAPGAPRFMSRNGTAISQVRLLDLDGDAAEVLPTLCEFAYEGAPHYYITISGDVFQLIEERFAACPPAGESPHVARASLVVALERSVPGATRPAPQFSALRTLMVGLRRRYRLATDAVQFSVPQLPAPPSDESLLEMYLMQEPG